MPSWIDLALLVLASFRLTHLLVFDAIASPLRERMERSAFLGDLIGCFWCCGVWVSAVLTAFYWLRPSLARPVLLALAVAGGQSLLEHLVQRKAD